jgi:uncharacterized protein YeeX (DUF496 family)
MNKKILKVVETATIDSENGEVINSKITTISTEAEPPFYKRYISDLGNLHKLSASENAVFEYFVSNMDYENVIYITPKIRRKAGDLLKISDLTVRDAVITFQKKDLFRKLDSCVYQVNPKYVAKVSWENVKKIRLSYEAIYEKGKEPVKNLNVTFE